MEFLFKHSQVSAIPPAPWSSVRHIAVRCGGAEQLQLRGRDTDRPGKETRRDKEDSVRPRAHHGTHCSSRPHAGKSLKNMGETCERSVSCGNKVVCIAFQKAGIKGLTGFSKRLVPLVCIYIYIFSWAQLSVRTRCSRQLRSSNDGPAELQSCSALQKLWQKPRSTNPGFATESYYGVPCK